jgi:hypothetical protein
MASVSSRIRGDRNAAPGQGSGPAEASAQRKRPPPAAIRNSTARTQTITASVSSHPAISSHAGKREEIEAERPAEDGIGGRSRRAGAYQ